MENGSTLCHENKKPSRIFLDVQPDGSLIDCSTVFTLQAEAQFNHFCIRHVVSGNEQYTINGRSYKVGAGTYLLANRTAEGSVFVESKTAVRGICIDIAHELISEAVAFQIRPDTAQLDSNLDVFFGTDQYLDHQYSAKSTQVGGILERVNSYLTSSNLGDYAINQEFYYALAEAVVIDHLPIYQQLQQLRVVKSQTRNALYRRVEKGKEFLDQAFLQPLTVGQIAREAYLSEYHFYRLFKQVYGMSPHQYIVHKRLAFAHVCLLQGADTVSDLAIASGFADVQSFCKAFKRKYGVTARALRRSA
jgi:AraC family transcriptional regulator